MNLIQTEEVFFVVFFLLCFSEDIDNNSNKKIRGKVLIRLMQSLYVLVKFL